MPLLSLTDLSNLLRQRLQNGHAALDEQSPFHRTSLESLDDRGLTLRRRASATSLRDGATWSGPAQFELVDMTGFLLCMANLSPGRDAMTINVNVNFLRPPPCGDLIAHGRLLRLSTRSAVVDVSLATPEPDDVVTHATASFAFPPASPRDAAPAARGGT